MGMPTLPVRLFLSMWLLRTSNAGDAAEQEEECKAYMASTGCSWTKEWNCRGENKGTVGEAGNDRTLGYRCCCEYGLWSERSPLVQELLREARAEQHERWLAAPMLGWCLCGGLCVWLGLRGTQ